MRKIVIPLIFSGLILAGCTGQNGDIEATTTTQASTTPADTTTTQAAPETYSLSDTVNLDGVVISDMELTQEGCEVTGIPAQDLVAFQLIATVENTTSEEVMEVLWPSEISFTDQDGFKIENAELVGDAEMWCENDIPREFNRMAAGEKRRAAVSLTAPAGASGLTYNTMLIPGALPTTWDISEELAALEITQAETPLSDTPTEETLTEETTQGAPVIGMTEGPGAAQPSVMNKVIQSCGDDPMMYQPGTTFFTDGTTGWTEQCAGLS